MEDDGEFWMSFDQFTKLFSDLSVCHLFNTSDAQLGSSSSSYHEYNYSGKWSLNGALSGTPKDRSGGCPNYPTVFYNPQFLFEVDNDGEEVTCSLSQDEREEKRDELMGSYLSIGMMAIKIEVNRSHRIHQVNYFIFFVFAYLNLC